jgi:hypothetical protein
VFSTSAYLKNENTSSSSPLAGFTVEKPEEFMVAPWMVGKDGLERAGVILDKTRAPSLFNWLKAATLLF